MPRKTRTASRQVPSSQHMQLLLALKTAAAAIQRAAHDEEAVYTAFSEQLVRLNLIGSISLLDEKGKTLEAKVVILPRLAVLERAFHFRAQGMIFEISASPFVAQVITRGETTYLSDNSSVFWQVAGAALGAGRAGSLKRYAWLGELAGIYAPLTSGGGVQGLLNVMGKGLTPEDVPIFEVFASHVSIALDNGRLFASLRKAEAQFRRLFEAASDGILLVDAQSGHIVAANPQMAQITGYSIDEILQSSSMDIFTSPALRKQTREKFRHLLREGAGQAELRLRRKDGQERWVECTVGTFDADGRPLVQGFIRDISAQKQAMLAHQESEAKFRVLTETTSSAILIYQNDLLVYVNPALQTITGYSLEELLTMRLRDLIHPEDGGLVYQRGIEQLREEDGPFHYEFRVLTKHGRERWVDFSAARIEYNGQPAGLGTAFDITHTKWMETDLLRRADAQAMIAVENARLYEAERVQLLLAQTLQKVGALLNSELSLQQVLEAILDLLGRVVEYDSVSIHLLDERGNLYLAAGRGFADIEEARQIVRRLSSQMLSRLDSQTHTLVISDTTQDSNWLSVPGAEYIHSWAGAPLLVRNRLIGSLNLDSKTPYTYTGRVRETVMAFANQAAIAIENARLFEAAERRVAEMEGVLQADLMLTASLEVGAVLDAILQSSLHLLPGIRRAHIFLYFPEEGGRLEFGAGLLADGKRLSEPLVRPFGGGITLKVAQSGTPVVVADLQAHPLFHLEGRDDAFGMQGSLVSLPLKIGPRVVGVMNISHPQPHAFNEAELRVLRLLGDQAAISIENARLYQQTTTEHKHLRMLYDIGRELSMSLDRDLILERAISLVTQALGGLVGAAYIHHPVAQRLTLAAMYGPPPETISRYTHSLTLEYGEGVIGWVACTRQPVIIADVNADSRWKMVPGLDDIATSDIAAPILAGDRVMGVMAVSHQLSNAFTNDDLALLQTSCQQIALALSNAERYQQVQNLVDLLASEQYRLESLVEGLPMGVLLLDGGYCIQVANPIGREILHLLQSGELGSVMTHLGPYPLPELMAHNDDARPVEIIVEDPHIFIEAQVRTLGGEPRQWVITLRNVTVERDNLARSHMQERLATVGQLAAGIAHDFNNIMAAILVYTDLVMSDRSLAEASRERLLIIRQQVQRAASLIRQILDFSRRSVMEQSTLDLLPFIKELDKLLSRVLPENIHVELSCQPGPYLVNADPARLQQVFMNLAVNARDAMPAGGRLRFELDHRLVLPGTTSSPPDLLPGKWVQISIIDSGQGIATDVLPHIFEPFFTTKPVGQGTGLGLSQVYGIIRQHNGVLDVVSQPDMGTCFTIYLPELDASLPDDSEISHENALDGSGKTVLLVEDDDTTREALHELLQIVGFGVYTATNGVEAMRILNQRKVSFDLVVTDVVMPEMGGVALYEILQHYWPDCKVLFITGHPLDRQNQVLLEKGGVHWLQKPFSAQDFTQAVRALLKP